MQCNEPPGPVAVQTDVGDAASAANRGVARNSPEAATMPMTQTTLRMALSFLRSRTLCHELLFPPGTAESSDRPSAIGAPATHPRGERRTREPCERLTRTSRDAPSRPVRRRG